MGYATITGQLKDSDGTAWANATWTAVPVSPSSKPVFPDGSPVPTTGGLCDATGHFSGQIPTTIDIRPPGTTLTLTITSMTSAPPLTLTKVQIVSTTTVDLGALLSPRLVAPRIKAAPVVYAYAAIEVTNPVHGNGYINTVENQSYIFMQNSWVKIGVGGIPEDVVKLSPHINTGALVISNDPPTTTQLNIGTLDTPNHLVRFASHTTDGSLFGGSFQFDTWDTTFSRTKTMLFFGDGGAAIGYAFVFYANASLQNGSKLSIYDAANAAQLDVSLPGGGAAVYNSIGVNASNYGGHTFRSSPLGNASHIDVVKIEPTNGGQVTINGALVVGAGAIAAIATNADNTYLDAYGSTASTHGGLVFRTGVKGDPNPLPFVAFDGTTRQANFAQDISCGALHVNGGGSGFVTTTQPFLYLQTAAGGIVGVLNNMSVNGTFSATGAKTFNIPHPLGGERRLVHACLEGPESGVYYRGEAELVDGRAIVELPDYFEALTFPDDRTVQLTQVDDGGELGLFAASPVVDGKFSIRSNVSAASVYWEVKAERRDIDRLDVEPATKGERSESES
jgi:hypothetical protein